MFAAWLRERVGFVIAAERAGVVWFVGAWKFMGPVVAIAGFLGLGAWLLGRVSPWIFAVLAVAFLVLLFVEGAYEMHRRAVAPQQIISSSGAQIATVFESIPWDAGNFDVTVTSSSETVVYEVRTGQPRESPSRVMTHDRGRWSGDSY